MTIYLNLWYMTGELLVNHTNSIPSLLNLSPLPILVTSGSGCTPRGFGVEWSAYQTPTWENKSPNHQETKLSVFLIIALTFEVTSLKNCRKVPFFNGKLSCGVLEGTTKIDKGVCHLSVNQYSLFGFNSTPGWGRKSRRCSTSPNLRRIGSIKQY